jgi:ribulose-bisphosphate carboxylase large chain
MSFDHLIFVDQDGIDMDEHIIATFEVEVNSDYTIEAVARTIAHDPTIGTWTSVGTDSEELFLNYCGKVILPVPKENELRGQIRIALPITVINPDIGGIPHLLAILGAPFGLKRFKVLRLINLDFPSIFIRAFPGPRFGLEGVYQRIGYQLNRPILSTMLKPRSGLEGSHYARLAFEALVGGIDIIFDDELMVSPRSAPLQERVPRVKEAVLQAEKITGNPKLYAVNITTSVRHITKVATHVKELGADILYVNPLVVGFSTLELLATDNTINLPILCCRSMHGVFHRGQNGIDKYVLLKLARLAGADGMHIGSISGKSLHELVGSESEIRARSRALSAKSQKQKRIIPILSGGIHPGNTEWNLKQTGHSVIIQAGSGVLGHPKGPKAGGKAMRDLVEGLLKGQGTLEISRRSKELDEALKKWGYLDGEDRKNV